MIKMDMIWIATALLIYPNVSPTQLVTRSQIENKIRNLFRTEITPIMLEVHLVSWEGRQADTGNPTRGGSRNRYLFRTIDGSSPSGIGNFRLYKKLDSKYDGWDKTARVCPVKKDIPTSYHYLVDWFLEHYH
jgi:hypothetical protein